MDKLPIYRFKVGEDDDTQLEAVAFVDSPAIEMNWQAFSNKQYSFKADIEKRIISGPLMVADLPIYRRDETGEYYGVFQAEDIYNLRNKFFKQGKANLVNEMHNSNKMIEGVYMIESFLIDSTRGINSPSGYNLTDGSWFGSYKVDNDEIWNDFIKSGEFKGFSVEGLFRTVKIDEKPQAVIEEIINIIKNEMSNVTTKGKEIFKKIADLLKVDFNQSVKCESAKLADGTMITWDGDLSEGVALMVTGTDGNTMPAPDAVHVMDDGTKITTVGGLVTAIEGASVKKEVETPEEMNSKFHEAVLLMTEKFVAMETAFNNLNVEVNGYKEKFEAIEKLTNSTKDSVSEKFEAIKKIVDEIAEQPAAVTEKPKETTFKIQKKSRVDELIDYKKSLN